MTTKTGKKKARRARKKDTHGWLVYVIGRALSALTFLSDLITGRRSDYQVKRKWKTAGRRALRVDTFVFICLCISLLSFFALAMVVGDGDVCWCRLPICLILWFSIWRIIDISSTQLRIAVWDGIKSKTNVVKNVERIVVLSIVNFLELGFCFANLFMITYWVDGSVFDLGCDFQEKGPDAITWLVFSMSNITLLGSEISAEKWMRLVVLGETFCGLLLIVISFGRFVSALKVKDLSKGE